MDDLERWLTTVGLGQLAPVFRANDVDLTVLADLTDADLEKIGVSLGLRKKLAKALAQLEHSPAAIVPSPSPAASTSVAERRQLTVMFCDLAGSTELSVRLDPETLRDILRAYQDAVAAKVARFGGHVAQYLGDGVLAYFGWPRAHEHEAESAVRTGLAVIETIKALPAPPNVVLATRIGIATGLVVVGQRAAQDEPAIGETPNLAARLQGSAAPNTVVIDAATRRLLGDMFEYEALGVIDAKGFALPVQAYGVVRQSRIESRFEAFHPSALTPLVGREEELDLLLRRWEQAKGGAGQVLMISGEPGIGKSRLVTTLLERIAAEPHINLRYFCSPHHRDTALHPIVSQIERAAGLERDDEPAVKLDKIEALFEAGSSGPEDRPLVAELLRLPDIGRYPPLSLSPQQRKQKTFDILLRQLAVLASRQPVLDIFEDVHWIDPTTHEALDRTIERIRQLPVLLVVTFRPEFSPPWIGLPSVTMITLNRLDRRDGAALIERVVVGNLLPPEIVNGIVERADGVPLFAEELTKAVLEAGGNGPDAARVLSMLSLNTVPVTLQASLMARLDRLGPAKEIAQIGAAIGRECSYEMLAGVSGLSEQELRKSIDLLTSSGLLVARGTPPDASYLFKHALVQDAAYSTLLISTRQQLHAKIAELLESRFPDQAQRQPELLAHHLAEANLLDRAIGHWIKAGRHAAERSANLEAITHLSRALDALKLLPETEERDHQELIAQTAISTPLLSVHGYPAPETGAAYSRARVLSQRLKDRAGIYVTLSGEFHFHFVRGDQTMMRHLTREAVVTAEAASDDSLRHVGHRLVGLSGMHFGEFVAARDALETIVHSYDASKHRPPPVQYVHDPKMYALAYLALILWIQGYPDQARRWSAAAIDYTSELNHANMTAFAHVYGGAGLHELLRDANAVGPHAQAVLELAEQHSLHYFKLSAMILRGWLMAVNGDPIEGATLMQRSIDERFAIGTAWYQTRYLCMLAEVFLHNGNGLSGLDLISRAKSHIDAHDEHMWQAEVERIEGELLRLTGAAPNEIENCFRVSLSTSRRQGAKSFELRTSTSLARFLREQDRSTDARNELAPVLGWFTEGLETADMRQAHSLLEELH